MKIAAVTMVWNEPVFLPLWLAHYGAQVGPKNLFVLDHGSDDGSTDSLGVNVLRLPRATLDEEQRAAFLSRFHAALLAFYDAVIVTDCDEMLVADPARDGGLADLIARDCETVLTAVGLNLLHLRDREPPLDPTRPVLVQRGYVRFDARYCKSLIARVPVAWGPGLHTCNRVPVVAPGLYLFHLRAMDHGVFRASRAARRALPWSANALDQGHGRQWRTDLAQAEAELFPVSGNTLGRFRVEGFDFSADLARTPLNAPFQFGDPEGAVAAVPERFRACIPGIDAASSRPE